MEKNPPTTIKLHWGVFYKIICKIKSQLPFFVTFLLQKTSSIYKYSFIHINSFFLTTCKQTTTLSNVLLSNLSKHKAHATKFINIQYLLSPIRRKRNKLSSIPSSLKKQVHSGLAILSSLVTSKNFNSQVLSLARSIAGHIYF